MVVTGERISIPSQKSDDRFSSVAWLKLEETIIKWSSSQSSSNNVRDGRYAMSIEPLADGTFRSRLEINNVTFADAGVYDCRMYYDSGTPSFTEISLNVQGL